MRANLKILILEDNKSDVDLIHRELKTNGVSFTSHVAQNQETFEYALDNFDPDIILSDFSLPAFDGLTAFNIKRHKFPDIPFIIISGTLGEERAVEMIKNGVTDYTLKDKLFTLTPKISRALKEAEEQKQKRIINEELKLQNIKLREIAFLQSHQVRVPIVQILGLFSLFQFDKPEDPINGQILGMLKLIANSLDEVILEIVQKTSEIEINN